MSDKIECVCVCVCVCVCGYVSMCICQTYHTLIDLLAGGNIHVCSPWVDGRPPEGAPPDQRVTGVQLGQWTRESKERRGQAHSKILGIHLYQKQT